MNKFYLCAIIAAMIVCIFIFGYYILTQNNLTNPDSHGVSAESENNRVFQNSRIKGAIVCYIPEMDRTAAAKDLIYKHHDGKELKLDIYYPPEHKKGETLKAVLLIHGSTPNKNFKDGPYFTSWGRLVAANGFAAVTFNWRSGSNPEDIADLIEYIRENASALDIDENNISILAFSMGVENAVDQSAKVDTGFIKSITAYYGKLPEGVLEDKYKNHMPPVFLAEAANDSFFSKDCNDNFVNKANGLGHSVRRVVHQSGTHGFDLYDDSDETLEIINSSIDFIKKYSN
ncbi:MAG: alpha/beta hydrolase family protein [Bacillota bacterium]